MSESILKALMQLFAIIARPESNTEDRRSIVESFLKQQLNQELVDEYLLVFDNFYDIYQKKQSEVSKQKKSIALSSVKVLKICTSINEELTHKQKVVVLIRLLEFIKADEEITITEQELEFVGTVSDTFHFPEEEYNRIKAFVLYSFKETPNSSKVLLIDKNKNYFHNKVKHIYCESLDGQIRVFNASTANMYVIKYLGTDEIYLNGQILRQDKVYIINPGSSIRNSKIKPIYYSDIISVFNEDKIKSKIIFDVDKIEYSFKTGETGLHEMCFVEESGRLVGIMGASGAGKSTLLGVLNGSYAPTKGAVLINGINIHTESDKIEGVIGHVSQDDLLIEELTVFQNLYYNAKLCFDNFTEFQIIRTVLKVLQNLGLFEIKHMVVGSPLNKKISGGQRKRLNIALELIREPSVLFLDEPTSGLSSRDSENIMDLLKELALKGKLVFVVIHQPSSDIFKLFDKLIILDRGGYLIYNGDPVDSIVYFKSRTHLANWNESECHVCGNVNPEQIFNIVESNVLDEYGNLTHTRKISPKEWNHHYLSFNDTNFIKSEIPEELPEITFKVPGKLKQFIVFVKRDVLSKLTNTQYLLINLLESPIIALFLAFIIRYYSVDVANEYGYTYGENSNMPVYIFMMVIVAIFIGLTVSAEEIIKDRRILKREAFLNLSRSSYLLSKVSILLVLSAIQAITFVLVGNTIMEIRGMYFHYWVVFFSACSFANLLGLNISDSFKTAVTIYILIPFLVIPQIILSGIIVKFDKLNPDISSPSDIPWYGEIITARWGYEALSVYQFIENDYEKQFYPYEKLMSEADYKKNYWLKTITTKIESCERSLEDPTKKDQIINDLALLKNEITKELLNKKDFIVKKDGKSSRVCITFNKLDSLNINVLNQGIINEVKEYFNLLNKYYIKQYNDATNKKDKMITELQKTDELKATFLEKKRNYYNESLSEFVRNSNNLERIVEYDNHLIQKLDPVFQNPEKYFIKAHFYAPKKNIFGIAFDTYWVNVIVIWFMTIMLYFTLYYSGLKRLLDKMEALTENIKKRFKIEE